jgi:branched-chain amino acid aminotransferase
MSINQSQWIFLDGEWKRWQDATVHVTTHALHYGSGAFEGIRAYETEAGPAVFRLGDHVRRLLQSCKILRMPMGGYDQQRLEQLCVESIARNDLRSGYIRPLVFRGAAGLGLNPLAAPVSVCVFAIEWGRYLGAEAIEQGVDAIVSSWRRFHAGTAVPLGKITGQYVTSQFVSLEARENGFGEGIMLDERGMVCEGAGENLFAVFGDTLVTNDLASSILAGITRDTVITLARDLGIEVRFEPISRDMLYLCDELFMTGTAAEVTPVRSVDRIPVGNGTRGPITERLQQSFFDLVEGRSDDPHGWLTPVPRLERAAAS